MRFLCAILVLVACLAGCRSYDPVEHATQVIPDFDPAVLQALPPQRAQPTLDGDATMLEIESWTDIAADHPRYFLWVNADATSWIMETGGFAGGSNWYGPVSVGELEALLAWQPPQF